MKTKLSRRFWWALSIFSLMGQVAWVVENMYFNVFIYKIFHASAADISTMVAASAVTATLTTVLMGALSDRVAKRKIFIWLGYVFWGVSIFAFVFLTPENIAAVVPASVSVLSTGVSLAILLDCVMTFFGSTANDAAFNAWLTDSTDSTNRGAAEGINAMMPLVAILVVFGGFMFFDLDRPDSWKQIFSIIGLGVVFIGFLGLFLIKEPHLTPVGRGYFANVIHGFCPSTVKKNPNLYGNLLAFILFNISIQIFMPYLILYYEISLGMTDYVLVMAPAIVLASVVTALWGKVYDKKGFFFSAASAMAALLAGYVVLFLTRQVIPVFIGSLLMMSGYLAGMAVFGARIRDCTPKGEAGRFQGVRIFSQVLVPGVVGPFIGKWILEGAEQVVGNDGTASFVPNANIFLGALIAALTVLPFLPFLGGKKKTCTVELETPFEEDLKGESIPLSQYPRPQMVRDSYLCLNGIWSLAAEGKRGRENLGKIRVPFPPESRLSGIHRKILPDETLIYQRKFTLPEGFRKDRVLLHFGAVDQKARVFLNNKEVGESTLPYLPFSLDVTDALIAGENKITVRVCDPMDQDLPWGKQRKKRGGMWYTPVSGIWQTVWLESVPKNPVKALRITTDCKRATIRVSGGEEKKKLILWGENFAEEYSFTGDSITLSPATSRLWTPEDPYLYRFTLICGEDRVESYFALREISVIKENGVAKIALNGSPYYFHGLLDQGYFPDGIFMPASYRGFREDILKMKSCGFNMLRKHIKLEPQIFYYECDRLGMAVFQDMINNGPYSFLIDTALPTVGLRRGIRHKLNPKAKEYFLESSKAIQDALFNHPSVLCYTIFNEGWGQFDADGCYRALKKNDPTRLYDATSGWFFEKESDFDSHHVYFKPVKLKADGKRPLVLSEFGGYSCKMEHHSFNPDNTYGYRFFNDREKWEEALFLLYEKEILPLLEQGLCATVLTQVSDVEDETNGLLTYDRKVLKADPKRLTELKKRLDEAFYKNGSKQ